MKSAGENYNDLAYAYWRMYVLDHAVDPSMPMYVSSFDKFTSDGDTLFMSSMADV